MSSFVQNTRSLPASGALSRYRLVKQDSNGKWAYSGAGDIAEAILSKEIDSTAASADTTWSADLLRTGMTAWLTASAAVTAGDDVYSAASGKINSLKTGFKIGVAREAATADGDIIEVELRPDFAVWFAKTAAVSTSISGTAAETAYDTTIAIPAGLLRAGSRGIIRGKVNIPTTTGTETLLFKVKMADGTNTVVLGASAALDVTNADIATFNIEFELPTATTIVSDGIITVGPLAAGTTYGVGTLSTAYAPTAAGTVSVTQTASSTGETSALQSLIVEIRR